MAVYVCSDIHGMYDSYMKLLDRIKLTSDDILYVLGDVIDRGEDGLRIIDDIMRRDNVKLFLGNHELFLLDTFGGDTIDEDTAFIWCLPNNGGYVTYLDFQQLSSEKQTGVLDFLRSCLIIKFITIGNKTFHLSHSSTLKDLKSDELYYRDLSHDDVFHVVWNHVLRNGDTMDFYDNYNKNYIYVSGHVRVQKIGGTRYARLQNIIDIDCGCSYGLDNSSLCCLRLDDMKSFYIK